MSLRFAFYSTMFSGIRKFCDYHFVSQFLLECIVDVLTNGLTCKFNNIFRKERAAVARSFLFCSWSLESLLKQ